MNDKLDSRKLLIQFLKYMVGGGLYFWSGLGIFAICFTGFKWGWLPSKLLADITGWTINYIIQRYWAFADQRLSGHDGQLVGKYIIVNGIYLVIDYAIVGGLYSVGISPYIGFFVSAGFSTVCSYIWYRFWVFKTDN